MIEEIVILKAAEEDLLSIYLFYEEWSKGIDFDKDVESRLGQIQSFPNSGRDFYRSYKKLNLTKFPYTIIYRIHGARVFVMGFFPLRVNPETILDRLK